MRKVIYGLLALTAFIALTGCTSKKKTKKPEVYKVTTRQHTPEPPYNRIRKVHLPSILPGEIGESGKARIEPSYSVQVNNTSVCKIGQYIADSYKYTHICTPSAESKKVSIKAAGSLEEITEMLSKKADVNISVDHYLRQVRIVNKS